MTREFLGRGVRFPVGTDGTGRIERSVHEADIEESIRIILGTAKGERLMRPDFGCGIHEYVFADVNPTTVTLIETSVEEALIEWEPRIEVRRIRASTEERSAGRLPIEIDYRVRRTNNEFNLVYPFYVEER